MASGPRRVLRWFLGAVVFLAVFAAFWPVLHNGFVDWDDPDNFLKNENYRGLGPEQLRWMFTTFHMGHYQPLSWVTLGMDFLWGRAVFGDGLDPRAYHLTNNLLHAAAAVLVFLLARQLLRPDTAGGLPERNHAASRRKRENSRRTSGTHQQADQNRPGGYRDKGAECEKLRPAPGKKQQADEAGNRFPILLAAALAALWFGLHPLRVESVAWATERRDVLSSFLLLATVLLYLRAQRSAPDRRRRWLAVSLVAYAASLLSRAMGTTLPLILLLLDWYPLRRFGSNKADGPDQQRAPSSPSGGWRVLLEKVPFVLLAAAAAVIAPLAQGAALATATWEQHDAMARFAQACYGLVFYLWKLVWPTGLSPIYEMHMPIPWTTWRYIVPIALCAGGAIGWAMLVIRRRLPAVVVAVACYVILLLPVLGLVQSGNQEVADRYSYLPSVCVALLAAGGLAKWWGRVGTPRRLLGGLVAVAVAMILAAAVLTWRQCGVWQSTKSLWMHAAAVSPDSSIAQNGYGWVLLEEQRYDEAMVQFRRAVDLQPANQKAHHNIWITLQRQGRTDELPQAYRDTIRVYPNFADAHYNLGLALQKQGDHGAAETSYRTALQWRPNYSEAHTNLAGLLARRGETIEALRHYEQAIQADGRNVIARCGLARLLHHQGRTAEAVEQVRAVLSIDPNNETAKRLLAEWTGVRD